MNEGDVVRKKTTAEMMVVVDPHPRDVAGFVACRGVDAKEGETLVLPEWELEVVQEAEKKVAAESPSVTERLAALEKWIKTMEERLNQLPKDQSQ